MRTLRLLLWLRWKLFLRSTSVGSRIGSAALTLLMLIAFSPAWLLGAMLTYAGVRERGGEVIPVAFGVGQLAWVSLGLLSGALGRSFDLDKFLRYPVRPRAVFAVNVAASLLGPVPLMMLPTLVAATLGAFAHGGLAPALATGVGGALSMLITGALLQVLLALLDEVLRRESMRFLATAVMSLLFVGIQFAARFATRELAQDAVLRLANHQITGRQALAIVKAFFSHVPTVAAPAAVAVGALEGSPGRVLLGLAASLALLAAAVLPGAALMRLTVRGGESASAPVARGATGGGRGSFAFGAGVLPSGIGLMLARELKMTLRNPQRLMSVFLAPLVSIVFFTNSRGNVPSAAGFTLAMLASAAGTASMMLFAYDGPGVRSFYLLPCPPRDLLLAKHLEVLLRFTLQLALAFGTLSLLLHGLWNALTASWLMAALAVVAITLAAGTAVSMRHPSRARRRGLATRGSSGWMGIAVSLGVFAVGALVVGAIWAARKLAGPTLADAAGYATAGVTLAGAVAVWWRSLDLNARAFVECREKLIEVLAKTEDD